MNDFESNLPPGCNESDIPGNSPQDRLYTEAMEESFELLDTCQQMVMEFVAKGFGEDFEFILREWCEERGIKLTRCKCFCHTSVLGVCLECCG